MWMMTVVTFCNCENWGHLKYPVTEESIHFVVEYAYNVILCGGEMTEQIH